MCDAVGIVNTLKTVRGLDDDERGVIFNDTSEGADKISAVNEFGLYSLILNSRKPGCKNYKKWVTQEVIPSIRKHGMNDNSIEKILESPDFGIQLLKELKKEREEKKTLIDKINELKPKDDYIDIILKDSGLFNITQIGKDYDMSAIAMNKLLHKLGVQYKMDKQWFLYAKYQGLGYTYTQVIEIPKSDGTKEVKMNIKWTQKGRLFLYYLLKESNVLPKIELEKGSSNEEKI